MAPDPHEGLTNTMSLNCSLYGYLRQNDPTACYRLESDQEPSDTTTAGRAYALQPLAIELINSVGARGTIVDGISDMVRL